ncbi:MAG TPA: winged helix-turn-helix domain-containing protein [Candidatus Acidoferrum sp.]
MLDIDRYELTCGNKPIRMERLPMDLLILLVGASGRLISRDEIIERLWGKDVFFDTDNGINTAIRKIRRALGEDPEKPQYIETVQGKGYRFKGLVSATTQIASGQVEAQRPRIMLAVLPFENLSGDPDQEYFSDGLTEETIMRFGKMSPRDLGVIARTSSMAYKHSDKSVLQIGQELGVDYVLEGSVRREQDRIRVTAQLIRVSDQIHLWAENFDRHPQSILDIHSEVGAAIAAQVKIELTPEAKRELRGMRKIDPQAYDYYLHGRYHWARLTFPEMRKATEYFRKATDLDPGFAMAFSGLADCLMILPINSDVAPEDVFPESKAAITRALALDQHSVEARTSEAAIKFWFDWDFEAAEAALRKAVSLNSNYSLANLYLAHVLSNVGRHGEALQAIQQARLLDPFSLIANAMYGQFLYQAGKIEESIDQLLAALEMESRFWIAHICLAKTYELKGMYAEALLACENAWEYSGGNTEALSIAGYVHAVAGDQTKAEGKIHEMMERRKERYVPPYNLALVFAGLGQAESAQYWLEQAFACRDVHMTFLSDHKWDSMRGNPQFQKIVERVGLRR